MHVVDGRTLELVQGQDGRVLGYVIVETGMKEAIAQTAFAYPLLALERVSLPPAQPEHAHHHFGRRHSSAGKFFACEGERVERSDCIYTSKFVLGIYLHN